MTEQLRTNVKTGLIGSSLIFAVLLLLSAYAWTRIPAGEQVPVHWGIDGQPDGFAGKAVALLVLPAIMLVLALVFALIARFEPRQRHLALSARAYTAVWLATLGLMAVLHVITIAAALGARPDMGLVMPVAIGVLFIIVGNYMGKVRSNFIFGIRTPWTLSSELAWDRAHRFGGKAFMLIGLLLALGALPRDGCLWFGLLLGELIGFTVLLSIYSYVLWRVDPARAGKGEARPSSAPRTVAVLTVVFMLGLAVAAGVLSLQSRPRADIETRAVQMVRAQAAGDYRAAEAHFDARMRAALPPEALGGIWQNLVAQHGPFQRIAGARVARCWPYTAVYVTARFTRADVTLRVVFDRRGQVSGYWLAGVRGRVP